MQSKKPVKPAPSVLAARPKRKRAKLADKAGSSMLRAMASSLEDLDADEYELKACVVDSSAPSLSGQVTTDTVEISLDDRRERVLAPLRMALGPMTERIFKIPLAVWFQVTTSGAGVVQVAANNDPTISPSWSSAAALFNQYRVKATKLTYVPLYVVNAIANLPAGVRGVSAQALLSFIDEDDATTLPNITQAQVHADSLLVHSGYDKIVREAKPVNAASTNPDDTWNDTSAPVAATQAVKLVGNHNLLAEVVANVVVEWEVEFRGLGA